MVQLQSSSLFHRHATTAFRFCLPLALLTSLLLTGCGSGSDGPVGEATAGLNAAGIDEYPRAYRSVLSGKRTELSADELGLTTGSNDTVLWRQLSGPTLLLSDSASEQFAFDAPAAATTAAVELEALVTRENGRQEKLPVTVTAVNEHQVVTVADASYRLSTVGEGGACRAPTAPPNASPTTLERVFPGISIPSPADMDQAPGDDSHWYVTSILGRKIYRFANQPDVSEADVVLDLAGQAGRLRSLAFHPLFASNGKIYVQIHNGRDLSQGTSIREFTWSPTLDAFDPRSERVILQVALPHENTADGEHPGGQLNFGNDGYLYAALGDGTQPGVFSQFSQDTDLLWGSLLRIDVDGGNPYAIPADNPFANGGGRPEIYAWGFRHPWKWNFDRATGELWLADVGWVSREEINRVVAGGNYGWPFREGNIACPRCEVDRVTVAVDPESFIDPLVDYDRDTGKSITGGYVYRGADIPDLQGVYVFGDYVTGKVFALRQDGSGQHAIELIAESSLSLVSFAQDIGGELYALDFSDGHIYRLAANPAQPDSDFPTRLSATGCVDMTDPERVLPGMIPYSVQSPLWSDGAQKSRWLSLPPDGKIEAIAGSGGDLGLPPGTVLVKHFRLFNRLIETRLFIRHDDGEWAGYSYAWNDSETEAELLPGARLRSVDGQIWRYPSRSECLQCHTLAAGRSLGLTLRQLNTHLSDGDTLYSQLLMLESLNLFSSAPDRKQEFAVLNNTDASVAARARAYLHVNCSGCHRPQGGGDRSTLDLRIETPLADMNLCNALPVVDTLGNPRARLLRPGEPANSILLTRMQRRDAYRMPPIGSAVIDDPAVDLMTRWIASLDGCQ